MSSIVFFHNPYSRGQIVHWMLEEVEAEYEVQLIDFEENEQKDPEFLEINPMGKIPTIIYNDTVVTECGAICTFLAELYSDKNLIPPEASPERAEFYRWMFFGAGCVEPALIDKMFPRNNEEVRPGSLGYGSYEDTVATLKHLIDSRPFVLGDKFSAADVYIASQVGWGMMVKTLEPENVFTNYVNRCFDRPAYNRMLEKAKEYTGES